MNATTSLRLLPWTSPDGKPCYLAADDGGSRLSRRADEIEALQLSMGTQLLGHARVLLTDRKADAGELRFLASRLCEALRDVLRVAESRGMRLPAYGEDGPAGDAGEPS
ncbi:hypothetical protein [Streptomyces milbemycinicus]|uniref:Uncharacterized protein n=1 Tax=Streptomyces milbemycinicus TaxID=476552 RepID=A0ABW8LQN4_9ACTN